MSIIHKSKHSNVKKTRKISQNFYNKKEFFNITLNIKKVKECFINVESFCQSLYITCDELDSLLGAQTISFNELHPLIKNLYNDGYVNIELKTRAKSQRRQNGKKRKHNKEAS